MIQKISFVIVVAAFMLGWTPVVGNLIHGKPAMDHVIVPVVFLVTVLLISAIMRSQAQ